MPDRFDPRIEILPPAQQEIWSQLAPAPDLSFVLYGGTAVALHLGHRISIDFDFFKTEPLEKRTIEAAFGFIGKARTVQEAENTLVLDVRMPSGQVRVSFFGGLALDCASLHPGYATKPDCFASLAMPAVVRRDYGALN